MISDKEHLKKPSDPSPEENKTFTLIHIRAKNNPGTTYIITPITKYKWNNYWSFQLR